MPIETYEEFKNWLYEQPRETCVLIAMRAALRVFPLVARGETSAPEKQKLALLAARATLTSGVAAKMPTPEVKAAAARAARAASATFAANAAAFAADAAVSAASATSFAISAFATDAAFAAYSAHAAARAATNADADIPVADLFDKPLWREPDGLMKILADKKNILDTGPEWAFWRDWYQGFLDGKLLDWDLQRRVAVEIGDDIWEAGPEAVAKEIERIQAAIEVEKSADDLIGQAESAAASIRGIGDNSPPSPIDEAPNGPDDMSMVLTAAQTLREEARTDKPQKARAARAVETLVGILKSCGLWTARKVDLGLDAAVKAAGVASVAWVTRILDQILELIESAQKWLGLLL